MKTPQGEPGMVASVKPHRDELGLGDGLMLFDGHWTAAADEATWSHRHPATGEQVASFPVASPARGRPRRDRVLH
jgi:aldehyde dehydrogenase (NAD+)